MVEKGLSVSLFVNLTACQIVTSVPLGLTHDAGIVLHSGSRQEALTLPSGMSSMLRCPVSSSPEAHLVAAFLFLHPRNTRSMASDGAGAYVEWWRIDGSGNAVTATPIAGPAGLPCHCKYHPRWVRWIGDWKVCGVWSIWTLWQWFLFLSNPF